MKALVTGGTGFIGSHLVEALLRHNYSVTCLVRDTSSLDWLQDYPINIIKGDCRDSESLKNAVSECDYIFHLAGLTKSLSKDDLYATNVEGTENLLKAIVRHNNNLRRFVYLSTLSVADRIDDEVKSNVGPMHQSEHWKSKIEGENCLERYKKNIPVTIIKSPPVYGPRDRVFFPVFKMIKRGLFPYWSKVVYPVMYIDDLVNGIMKAAGTEISTGKTYYLSDLCEHTNVELADTIAQELNCKCIKLRIPKRVIPAFLNITGKLMKTSRMSLERVRELNNGCMTSNCDRAFKDFRFKPEVNIREGVRYTATWYRIHKWL